MASKIAFVALADRSARVQRFVFQVRSLEVVTVGGAVETGEGTFDGGAEVEVGILALVGVLLDFERVVTVLENQRPKRGPGGFGQMLFSFVLFWLGGSGRKVHKMVGGMLLKV